ncbi:MAG: Rne/Rng family ribonuclease [Thermodesulfobacteriota bacterium]
MVKKMLINASNPEECRVAVVCDGFLEELDVQVKTWEPTVANIYKAVITRIEPSLQAAFVDYGAAKNGFLSISDVHPSYFPESFVASRKKPRIQDVFRKDDHVIVQVNKEERNHKGASLTTNLSLAGRYLVLMPGTDLVGVSRKIEDEKQRAKLKDILKQLTLPEHMGFIIRTAGIDRTKAELARDLSYLLKLWEVIEAKVQDHPAPSLLYKEADVVIRSIRDHFSTDIAEILVDDKDVFKRARDFVTQVMPRYQKLVKLHQEKRPLFNRFQLEEQVERVYRRKVNLKSGGYILIEPTEAVVTIDVNSGSATREKGIEETAFRVNMEAAPEIARQLRLRDLGGIIVIDFIDMISKKHNSDVEKALKTELKKDRAKCKVLKISALGVLELSRQRLKSSLGTGEYLECAHCGGRGMVRSPEATATSVFRRLKSTLCKPDIAEIKATVPAKVAEYLLNKMRPLLVDMESQSGTRVIVLGKENLLERDIALETLAKEELPAAEPVAAVEAVIPVAGESALVKEEEAAPNGDKKKARRSSRRRRRGKRKTNGTEEAGAKASESLENGDEEGPLAEEFPLSETISEVDFGREEASADPFRASVPEFSVAHPQETPVSLTSLPEAVVIEAEVEPQPAQESRVRRPSLRDYLPFS